MFFRSYISLAPTANNVASPTNSAFFQRDIVDLSYHTRPHVKFISQFIRSAFAMRGKGKPVQVAVCILNTYPMPFYEIARKYGEISSCGVALQKLTLRKRPS